jgi:hypothetical protein
MLAAAPSLLDSVAAAGVPAAAADVAVESRSSAELPLSAVKASVVPGATRDDTPATPATVHLVCPSPASVPPTASPDDPLPTVPAVPIPAASVDQATLELSEALASPSQPSPPLSSPSAARSAAVDPTPADGVPPLAPAAPVELSPRVPTLSAACSARLDDGTDPAAEAAAVAVLSTAPQLAVDARVALLGDADGAADAQSAPVRISSAGSALADMVCSCAVAETRGSVLTGVCVEWPGSVGRRAELEPNLAVDVGRAYPVSVPSMPGLVVSHESEDAEVELVTMSGAVDELAAPDAPATAKLPVDGVDTGPVSASSSDAAEVV